ncbi:MAG: hypothetical protein ABR497_09850 [Kiritimatiellia bacterium]
MRQEMGLQPDDLLILQPTRIVPRKGIEHAVTLIKMLDNPRCKLIVPHEAGDEAQMIYQFTLPPLMLYCLLQGDARPLNAWAAQLAAPPVCTFLNFLASHDGIGVRPLQELPGAWKIEALAEAGLTGAHSHDFISGKPTTITPHLTLQPYQNVWLAGPPTTRPDGG